MREVPFVHLDNAETQAFFDVAREELREGETISEHFPLLSVWGQLIFFFPIFIFMPTLAC